MFDKVLNTPLLKYLNKKELKHKTVKILISAKNIWTTYALVIIYFY